MFPVLLMQVLCMNTNLQAVGVSAATGQGVKDFFDAVQDAVKEYYSDYKPEIDRLRKEQVGS